jgi:hypothetical protein
VRTISNVSSNNTRRFHSALQLVGKTVPRWFSWRRSRRDARRLPWHLGPLPSSPSCRQSRGPLSGAQTACGTAPLCSTICSPAAQYATGSRLHCTALSHLRVLRGRPQQRCAYGRRRLVSIQTTCCLALAGCPLGRAEQWVPASPTAGRQQSEAMRFAEAHSPTFSSVDGFTRRRSSLPQHPPPPEAPSLNGWACRPPPPMGIRPRLCPSWTNERRPRTQRWERTAAMGGRAAAPTSATLAAAAVPRPRPSRLLHHPRQRSVRA